MRFAWTLILGFFAALAVSGWAQTDALTKGEGIATDTPMIRTSRSMPEALEPAHPTPYWLDVGLFAGMVEYQETVSIDPTVSDWRSAMLGVDATFHYQRDRLRANFSGDFWYGVEADEEWTTLGFLGQRNDMDVFGLDWLAEVGYALDPQGGASITPYIGLGYRYQEYSRSNFNLFRDEFDDLGRVDETFDLYIVNSAVELENQLSDRSLFQIRADLGLIVANTAINTAIPGDLDGDGGFIFRAEGMWKLKLRPNQSLQLGVYVEHQENNGSVDRLRSASGDDFVVEWPDNDLERIGIRAAFEIDL